VLPKGLLPDLLPDVLLKGLMLTPHFFPPWNLQNSLKQAQGLLLLP